jgi:hypothetical protein
VEEVAALVSGVDPRLTQAVKWGRLTFAVDDNWHHWLCGIAVTSKRDSLVFHKGVLLDDPERLLTGTGRYVRQLPLAGARQHPDAVARLVRSAIEHETDSLESVAAQRATRHTGPPPPNRSEL